MDPYLYSNISDPMFVTNFPITPDSGTACPILKQFFFVRTFIHWECGFCGEFSSFFSLFDFHTFVCNEVQFDQCWRIFFKPNDLKWRRWKVEWTETDCFAKYKSAHSLYRKLAIKWCHKFNCNLLIKSSYSLNEVSKDGITLFVQRFLLIFFSITKMR